MFCKNILNNKVTVEGLLTILSIIIVLYFGIIYILFKRKKGLRGNNLRINGITYLFDKGNEKKTC